MNRTLKKTPALDRFFNNIVAKSERNNYHLYQKSGKRNVPVRGRYVLVQFTHIKADSDDEAIEKAESIIKSQTENGN